MTGYCQYGTPAIVKLLCIHWMIEKKKEQEDDLHHEKKPKREIVTQGKKKCFKHFKSLVHLNPAEKLTTITIFVLEKSPSWSNCSHCTNVNNIFETWCEEVDSKVEINLLERMYFLTAFTFSQFKIYDFHYLFVFKIFQLIGMKAAVLAGYMKSL